jgi:hypothetical protein
MKKYPDDLHPIFLRNTDQHTYIHTIYRGVFLSGLIGRGSRGIKSLGEHAAKAHVVTNNTLDKTHS